MKKGFLSPEEMFDLENGQTIDPFQKLGFHHAVWNKQSCGLIRVFNPLFKEVKILSDEGNFPCEFSSGAGCFEALFPNQLEFFPYRVQGIFHNGQVLEYNDPYAILPVLNDYDLFLFGQGTHYQIWKKLGANPLIHADLPGIHFAVWAPNAKGVSVVGDFNNWNKHAHLMRRLHVSGIWEIFIPEIQPGSCYKFSIHTSSGTHIDKLDPYAKEAELRPRSAAVIANHSTHVWGDKAWNKKRPSLQSDSSPLSIYEVHLGSWRRKIVGETGFYNYRELAALLIPYVKEMGYTHLELMPIEEHPLDESWGYQVLGYYAPTKRYGSPDDLRYFIDACHQESIGVILDWVPAHFPSDAHGLDVFDGTQLYAHEDPRKGQHPQWGTRIFNYSRKEVSNFLIGNALYWLEEFHFDGLRVDAVASMLYLDYARDNDAWLPNPDGSNINHEAVEFLKHMNSIVAQYFPDRLMIAEESSAFPQVTHELSLSGLGFNYKWNLGWMNDVLGYVSKDPIFRRFHQNLLTFALSYSFSEKFCLVLSHDEVVHGKKSLLSKMPGDDWQKFANNRLAFAYLYSHPGKKLHFMGMEFGQWTEWNEAIELDWHLLEFDRHRALRLLVKDLNTLYREKPAMHEQDNTYHGFQWVDFHDADKNMISFLRKGYSPDELVLCIFNFSPVPQQHYRLGVPREGYYREILNTDSVIYGGSNVGNLGGKDTDAIPMHQMAYSVEVSAPPLAACFFQFSPQGKPKEIA